MKIYEFNHDKLEKHDGHEAKVKTLALVSKHESDQEEKSQSEDVEDDALIKKFEKFLRKEMSQRETSTLRGKGTYFEFRIRGYVKIECPTIQKKIKVNFKKDRK